ncbi:tetratricopeptide repeat protein [Leucothrix pacifica]|uniref:tetratricopeptide repeat protein n=1 Tax=Leucothrix pacifica TaxID=1247513 RepID=UPI0015E84941|nr:tetratricopeptide repeat protein [Leucothrix pacifica]
MDAWAFYHKARSVQAVYNKDSQHEAIQWSQKALEKDPDFAAAYGEIARAKGVQFFYQWTKDEEATLQEAIDTAEQSIRLDPNDPGAYAALGYVYRYTGDETRAIANLERAAELNPSNANIRLELAHTLDWFRHQDRALPEIEQAIKLSPRDPRLQNMYFYKVHILFHLKAFEHSLEATRGMSAALTTDTWRMYYHLMRAANFAQLDRTKDAEKSIQSALKINGKLSVAAMRKKFEGSKNHPENRRFWLESLAKAGLP